MSVSIRLARGGAKKRPYYRIVVANSRSARDGRFIEKIGSYNPLLAKEADLDPDFAEKFLNFIVTEVIRHHEKLQGKG